MLRVFSIAFALAFCLLGEAMPAQAQVSIDIRVGTQLNHGRRISCFDGQRMLERRGFRDVRARDCRGRYFNYTARRQGLRWWIDVRARDGRIVRADRRR